MPYKLNVDLPAVNGGIDYALLVGKADVFPYENGKRLSDMRTGVKLTLALQGAGLSTMAVKFDHDPLPRIANEQIEAACAECKFLLVQIPDCIVNLYSSNGGGIGMTATAQTAQIVTLNGSK